MYHGYSTGLDYRSVYSAGQSCYLRIATCMSCCLLTVYCDNGFAWLFSGPIATLWESTLQETGRDNVVGIATRYGLEGPGIEFQLARFSAPIQTRPGAHPASCTMGTGSFSGVKTAGA